MRPLATPGAVLMLVGLVLVYWALTSKHGDPPKAWLDVITGNDNG